MAAKLVTLASSGRNFNEPLGGAGLQAARKCWASMGMSSGARGAGEGSLLVTKQLQAVFDGAVGFVQRVGQNHSRTTSTQVPSARWTPVNGSALIRCSGVS